ELGVVAPRQLLREGGGGQVLPALLQLVPVQHPVLGRDFSWAGSGNVIVSCQKIASQGGRLSNTYAGLEGRKLP
ncbi:MAG: hypothetical protein II110_00655, partial [Treponema sp.]|nr:hypothetical protein [Treponema sp.]